MWSYLDWKIAEYSIVLEWIRSELTSLRASGHSNLIAHLKHTLSDLRKLHRDLAAIIRINEQSLAPTALRIIHLIELRLHLIRCRYVPGLKRENQDDRSIRRLLLPSIGRWGLSWVKDVLIRLDGPYATIVIWDEYPIIFAPPQQAKSLLQMVAIYHEVGHNVFSHFDGTADNLASVVSSYFTQLKREAGPISPAQRESRDREIDAAEDYWLSTVRLDEFFSDVFATFVCGPAYALAIMDLAIRSTNPFESLDGHPPPAARTRACQAALLPVHRKDKLTKDYETVWNEHLKNKPRGADYDRKCPDSLLELLVRKCIQEINRLLPTVSPYSEPIAGMPKAPHIDPSDSLEIVLNKALGMLLSNPHYYQRWEEKVLGELVRNR